MRLSYRQYLWRQLRGTAATLMFVTISLSAASADEPVVKGVETLINVQRVPGPGEHVGNATLTSIVDGHYANEAVSSPMDGSTTTVGKNNQSAEALGNVVNNALNADTITASSADASEETPFSVLSNQQVGDGDANASSHMMITPPTAISGSSVTVFDNVNTALAHMNEATNASQVTAINADGNNLLLNRQEAGGHVSASAITNIGDAKESLVLASRHEVKDNATKSDATANLALNGLNTNAVSVAGAAILNNDQTNDAVVDSVSTLTFDPQISEIDYALVSLTGNSGNALARGNVVENTLKLTSATTGGTDDPDVPASLAAALFAETSGSVGASLNNNQTNGAAVSATTTLNLNVALNCGCVTNGGVDISNNSADVAASGNGAINAATVDGGGKIPVTVNNVQTNAGAIAAKAIGTFQVPLAKGSSSTSIAVNASHLAATAIGNQAVNNVYIAR